MIWEHDYFGLVDEHEDGSLGWTDTVTLSSDVVDIVVTAAHPPADTVTALDDAAALLQHAEGFDARARDALIAELSVRQSVVVGYIDDHVDLLGDDLTDFLVYTSGDIAMDVLRSLRLMTVEINLEQHDPEESFACFSYSFAPDESDSLLRVFFDARGDVVDIGLD